MSEILKKFAESQLNSVEGRYTGSWPVYGDYDLVEREGEGKGHIYVVRSNFDPQQIWRYAPLREPVLFIEFAELFDRTKVSEKEAAPRVLDWVKRYGTLGANSAFGKIVERRRREWLPSDGLRLKVHGTFSTGDTLPHNVSSRYSVIDTASGAIVWSPPLDIQSVDEFVMHSTIAHCCWRLLSASKARGGPDAETLRDFLWWLGVENDGTPAQLAKRAKSLVDEFLNIYLRKETCIQRYQLGDGKSIRGPGSLSLLGALFLQMSNFRDAEEITYCKWCGDVVTFEQGGPPPRDAPKGTRGKHKTHSNREYCKEKHGVKDYCKNQFNAQRRKKAKTAS